MNDLLLGVKNGNVFGMKYSTVVSVVVEIRKKMNKTGLVWFRNDLRIHDQKSIARACETNDSVLGLYCFDPRHYTKDRFGFKKTEKFRAQFLLETVTALKANLDTLHIPLITMFEKPENTLPDIIKKYGNYIPVYTDT